jgi:hypothetical protein
MPVLQRGLSHFQRLPLNNGLLLYLLDSEAVLYSATSRRLFGLDCAATVILLRLSDGETLENLTTGLGMAETAAIEELAAILDGKEPPSEEYRSEPFCPDAVPQGAHSSPCYRLLTTRFTLTCFDQRVLSPLSDCLRHLLVPDQPYIDLAISIEPEGSLWRLCLNGTTQGSAMPAAMLLPLLSNRLRTFAYQHTPYLLVTHAAVVSDGHTTVVFPGQSGSGKSTLAASLLARGYRLFSDELAMLDANGDLVPIPLGLGLKSGSWSLLEEDFPTIVNSPEHIRRDGIRVRYLDPGTIPFTQGLDNRLATHLCFPRYQPEGPDDIVPLSPVQAFRALTEAGYQVRGLDEERVERIVTWLLGLSCFALTYSSTEKALQLLGKTINNPLT